MMKISKSFFLLLIFLFILSCGFKPIKFAELSNFDIANIETSGDKRVNYIIKKNLLMYSKNNQERLITININSNKTKVIKEKNINNEITKYEISITANISFKIIENEKYQNFIIKQVGDFDMANQYSQSLNNEKKLIELLSEKIAQEAINKIITKINAI